MMDPRFASAVQCMQAGQLAEAERLCRAILAASPNDAPTIHLLGFIAHKAGRHQEAIDLIGNAIALDENNADCHFNIGLALMAAGRLNDAATHFGRAVALKPDYAAGVANLVDHVNAQGNRALELGRLDEAIACYGRVVALKPGFAEAFSNLGVALMAQGRPAEAAAAYRRALDINPGLVATYRNLGRALVAQGDVVGAVGVARRALDRAQTDDIKTFFALCARGLPPDAASDPALDGIEPLLAQAMREGWGRPAELAPVAAALIRRKLSADNALLLAHLETTPVRDIALERWLTGERRRLLMGGAQGSLDFACALARQCFINEYVFAQDDSETEHLAKLRDAMAAATDVSPARLTVLAAYVPLHSLPNAPSLLGRPWPAPLQAVLDQQVREPLEELSDRARIPALTAITDAVSRAVRDQYEQMPYPRWATAALPGARTPIDQHLRGQFRRAPLRPLGRTGRLDVLVAGCGTGEQPIETARRYADADVLAVDLSLASLAYARRMARKVGIGNIAYAQADILELGAIDRRFDVIESTGVLHHLADPWAGWRVLMSLLRPNGLMFVALYSRRARQAVTLARAFIAQRGFGSGADDIRRCRQEIMALDDSAPLKAVTRFGDFSTVSNCRDLLFHVQERQVDLAEIKAFLAANGLTFIGFLLDPAVQQAYLTRFPRDPAMIDLACWSAFEADNPDTFGGMYQFWVQAP
jgi:tetratricopeptide (TPR) repeat protein/SAM-dependent methyltransferase